MHCARLYVEVWNHALQLCDFQVEHTQLLVLFAEHAVNSALLFLCRLVCTLNSPQDLSVTLLLHFVNRLHCLNLAFQCFQLSFTSSHSFFPFSWLLAWKRPNSELLLVNKAVQLTAALFKVHHHNLVSLSFFFK